MKYLWKEQNLPDEIYFFDFWIGESSDVYMKEGVFSRECLPAPIFFRAPYKDENQLDTVFQLSSETCTVTIPNFRTVLEAEKEIKSFLREL